MEVDKNTVHIVYASDDRFAEILVQFIAERSGKIQQGDQGALNAVLSHDTFCFVMRFNSVTSFYDFTYNER